MATSPAPGRILRAPTDTGWSIVEVRVADGRSSTAPRAQRTYTVDGSPGTYQVRVRATFATAPTTSDWSPTQSFVTTLRAPGAVTGFRLRAMRATDANAQNGADVHLVERGGDRYRLRVRAVYGCGTHHIEGATARDHAGECHLPRHGRYHGDTLLVPHEGGAYWRQCTGSMDGRTTLRGSGHRHERCGSHDPARSRRHADPGERVLDGGGDGNRLRAREQDGDGGIRGRVRRHQHQPYLHREQPARARPSGSRRPSRAAQRPRGRPRWSGTSAVRVRR